VNRIGSLPDPDTGGDGDLFLERHGHLVRPVVDRLRVSVRGVFDDDDAMQAGLLGLLAARDGYHNGHGASFDTYAVLRIRGAILDAVRAIDPVGRASREAARAIAAVETTLRATLGREPTRGEVAARLGISAQRYEDLRRSSSVTTVSLDEPATPGGDGAARDRGDTIVDPVAVDPGDDSARNDELITLVREVSLLGERNRRVIALYYRDELTFREIASVLGVSESRACQIHRGALQRLREGLGVVLPGRRTALKPAA
jgi:RNA polymerase sigma factor for flagellar operon FliA